MSNRHSETVWRDCAALLRRAGNPLTAEACEDRRSDLRRVGNPMMIQHGVRSYLDGRRYAYLG